MLYYIPIEPYDTRYTADWIPQFEKEFEACSIKYQTILGENTSSKVTNGGVLDACGTHIYKFSQLSKIMKLINDGKIIDNDILFFADLWFPGLESLFYVKNMLNLKFKICGIFHAGTYDHSDFTYRTGMSSWGRALEASWFNGIDKIFVATDFHKRLLLDNSIKVAGLPDKIVVTGLPFYAKELRETYKGTEDRENILVFPHRVDIEKHPEMFDELVEYLKSKKIEFTPCKTIISTKSREDYFRVLAKSKVMVSFADQETFGYSTLESMALGNIVVVPNRLSYVETVPYKNRYNTKEQCFEMVENALLNYKTPIYSEIDKWRQSIKRMLYVMEECYGV